MRSWRTMHKRAKLAHRREVARRQFQQALLRPIDPQVFVDVGRRIQECILDAARNLREVNIDWSSLYRQL